jgi:hypothetical protein
LEIINLFFLVISKLFLVIFYNVFDFVTVNQIAISDHRLSRSVLISRGLVTKNRRSFNRHLGQCASITIM